MSNHGYTLSQTKSSAQLYIYPYKSGSQSAHALAEALSCPVIKHTNSKFRGAPTKTVINWGASKLPEHIIHSRVINCTSKVKQAGNKLRFFESQTVGTRPVEGTSVIFPRLVTWTANKDTALKWKTVVARTVLTGHSGQGIWIGPPDDTLPEAPLYTKYVPKDSEWRVHIAFGEVIDVQRKIRNPDREPTDWKVRSHQNGFIYVRESGKPPSDVLDQAVLCYNCSGLDFGAVDVIWSKKLEQAFVLELNCAPGITGHTVEVYRNAFLNHLT